MAVNPIPLDQEPRPEPAPVLSTRIAQVTLLEDRAQVRREGKIKLPAGDHRLSLPAISPVASDRSLVARAGKGATIREARVVRRWRIGAEERPGEAAKLAEELARLVAEINRKNESYTLLVERRGQVEQASGLLVEGINRELPFAREFGAAWPKDLEGLQAQARSLDAEIRAAELEMRELQGKLAALHARAVTTGRPDHVLSTEIQLEVTVREPGEVALTVDYLVPCALWRPIHRATLRDGALRFECEGAVWQATGEDWAEVDLFFSTARPTQRSEPPVLVDDVLQVKPRVEKKVEVSIREEVIQDTGEGGGKRESGDLPGVDDGGETRLLGASRKATIPSDGRLYRVPVFAFEGKTDTDRVARPELSRLVHLRSKQANAAKHPILAGPVELIRGSGYVGRGMVEFVAPGESFVLGWGGEESLRVKRMSWENRETARLTGKQTITRTVELLLSNLDDSQAGFRLEERIPVSEIASVEVTVDTKETSPSAVPDQQGIVAWPITLPAHGTQKVRLVYRLVAGSEVKGV